MTGPSVERIAAVLTRCPDAFDYWVEFAQDDLSFEEWAERKARIWMTNSGPYVRNQRDVSLMQDVWRTIVAEEFPA